MFLLKFDTVCFVEKPQNTKCIVFGLTRPGIQPLINHTRGEHANHYTTDAGSPISCIERFFDDD
jgi:hypothetical protein